MSSLKIMLAGAVSGVVQFGLAIAGWRGWHAFFAHPALRALAWVTAGLLLLAIPSGGGLSSGVRWTSLDTRRSSQVFIGRFEN